MKHKFVFLWVLVLSVAILIADIYTKRIVLEWFMAGKPAFQVNEYLNIVLVYNPGVSFGLLDNLGDNSPLAVMALTSIILLILAWWIGRELLTSDRVWQRSLLIIAQAGIIGGGIGNLIDRFRFGAVVDFLDFHVQNYHWPAFNVADAAISIAAIAMLGASWFSFKQQAKHD